MSAMSGDGCPGPLFALAAGAGGAEGWKQARCASALADGKCDGCAGRPMAGGAGVCVGGKGMLAARKDQGGKKKEKKEPYQRRWSPKRASSWEKGFSPSPGMRFSPQQETWGLLELRFGGLALGWWCRDGFNPTKRWGRDTSTASGRRRLSAARQGNLPGNAFSFREGVMRQRGGIKRRSHLDAERCVPARTSVTTVPADLAGGGWWHPHPTPTVERCWSRAELEDGRGCGGGLLPGHGELWAPGPEHGLSPCTLGGAVGYFHRAPKGECPVSQAACRGRGLDASRRVREGSPARGISSPGGGRAGAVRFPASALPSWEHRHGLEGSRSALY